MKQIKYYYDEAINKIKLKKLKLETIVKNMKFPFLILFSIYLIGYSSIIRANFAYIDDLGRINAGYRGWENWSRFTSNFLSSIIHTSRYLDDISPLTQLIAIVFLTLAGLIVLRFFTNREKFTFTEYAAASIMGFFPFFLECISYKFDAPYMALSILASVFPIVFLKNKILYFITTILSTLVVCTTYQAANGIFPILVILCAINFWNQKDSIRDIIRFIYISCGGYIIGLLIFKVFIMVPVDSYVSNSISSFSQLIPQTVANYKTYFNIVRDNFHKIWIILITILFLLYIFTCLIKSKNNKKTTFLLVIISSILFLLLPFGLYPVLSNPLFAPRAMYGLGVCISLITIYVIANNKTVFNKIIILSIFWCFFVFSFSYGNALHQQQKYTDFRINLVINDLVLNKILNKNETYLVKINGSIGYAPVLIGKNNMLKRLVPITFGDSNQYWLMYEFRYHKGLTSIAIDNKMESFQDETNIISENQYHSIWKKDNKIIIELN